MAMPPTATKASSAKRIKAVLLQVATVGVIALIIGWFVNNTLHNLEKRGITVGFDFLERAARFPIAESIVEYTPTDSFAWALFVGFTNTLFITLVIVVISTVLGLFVGLARRSDHPLIYGVSSAYVEAIRNTPLVVQLLFCYAIITFGLPHPSESYSPISNVFLTNRGLYVPRPGVDGPLWVVLLIVLIGGAITFFVARHCKRMRIKTGQPYHYVRYPALATAVLAIIGWIVLGIEISVQYPHLGKYNFEGGLTLTPEFVAILVGLTLYSTAFSGEIIRGGIDAVPKGQWEAARAIGLAEKRVLRFVILPQALRVIIPPMTSQYINIAKNSTLAMVVGYPDINFVTATTINQTGQAIEGIAILMLIFIIISLSGSVLMNIYNRKIALVER